MKISNGINTFFQVILALALLLAFPSFTGAESEVLRKIYDRLEKDASFQSVFTQTTYTAALNRTSSAEGILRFSFPSLSRWDYKKPEEHIIIIDAEKVQFIDPVLETLTVKKINRGAAETAIVFLSGQKNVYKDFDEIKSPTSKLFDCKSSELFVKPRNESDNVKEMHFCYDSKSYRFDKIAVFEKNMNRRTFQFSKYELVKPEYSLFQFSLPKGWELISDR